MLVTPDDPLSAPSTVVDRCKHEQWFADDGGSDVSPLHSNNGC
jgi:hypothetical protein